MTVHIAVVGGGELPADGSAAAFADPYVGAELELEIWCDAGEHDPAFVLPGVLNAKLALTQQALAAAVEGAALPSFELINTPTRFWARLHSSRGSAFLLVPPVDGLVAASFDAAPPSFGRTFVAADWYTADVQDATPVTFPWSAVAAGDIAPGIVGDASPASFGRTAVAAGFLTDLLANAAVPSFGRTMVAADFATETTVPATYADGWIQGVVGAGQFNAMLAARDGHSAPETQITYPHNRYALTCVYDDYDGLYGLSLLSEYWEFSGGQWGRAFQTLWSSGFIYEGIAGQPLRLEVQGTTLRVKLNGSTVHTTTNSGVTAAGYWHMATGLGTPFTNVQRGVF